jgi:hypothetical protein
MNPNMDLQSAHPAPRKEVMVMDDVPSDVDVPVAQSTNTTFELRERMSEHE